jgi:OOP family OmpA-OmpF porin
MKRYLVFLMIGFFLQAAAPAEAQSLLKKVQLKAKEKSDRASNRAGEKTDEKIDQGVDNSIDKAFEGAGNMFKDEEQEESTDENDSDNEVNSDEEEVEQNSVAPVTNEVPKAWSKYNFTPGDNVIFEDNLENEENGEFPSKWDLHNGNVEMAVFDNEMIINFPSTVKAEISPLMKEKGDYLPEIFTVEFDAYFSEFCTGYSVYFYDMINQKRIEKPGYFKISPDEIYVEGKSPTDFTEDENYPYWGRIAIAFNVRSLKVFFDEQRISNIPNLGTEPTGISIASKQCHDGKLSGIKNIRIATGAIKLYDRVVTDGKFVTNGIRFDSGNATLRPESMGVINQIYKMLSEHPDDNFSIGGHTDSDGNEDTNLKLSEERAMAVKDALIEAGISEGRLTTSGHGESEPIDTNDTPEGKANNRRVEFVKI